MGKVYFGVDVGGTTVKIGVFDISGDLVEKWNIPTRRENNGEFILRDIAGAIKAKCEEKDISISDISGIGVGIPGPVTTDGTVLKCANLGWGIVPVAKELGDLTGVDNIKVGNDANVAALGEMWKGGGKGFLDVVMVTLGTGVGGGIILGGEMLSGNKGAAGEIGHLLVNPDETESCGCGKKGCLEQYASATGIVRMARQAVREYKEQGLEKETALTDDNKLSAKRIFDCAKNGDKLALEIIGNFGEFLAVALAQVAQVIDPEVFVIGGGVSAAGQIIIDVVKERYDRHVLFALRGKEFRLAELGNDAGIIGCCALVMTQI